PQAAPGARAPVDELCVHAERDVVEEEPAARAADVDATFRSGEGAERRRGIVALDPKVAREVVAGPERDADERGLTFERRAGDRRQRAVPAGDPEHLRR